ncbi:MgtC/SapB family protein [Aporhodopirellula aestuarii]|uniref:MgtC/SapB family protein n=1 Tax=Aporhodopirellula aestuarii TaxID=2950107 RepID=A0ABT0UAA4_9BACT|nr:MgtC/SapB family protein [Aporhodopirellula aestuarii]MCM2373816.1 MgtC/SapB family protein [Aporhodopirellula aestuarii]
MQIYQAIAISLGLGLLVGLQRQWKVSEIAGIRTFPLIAIFGTLCTLVGEDSRGWMCAAGLLAIAVLLTIANVSKIRSGDFDAGMTTEVAALLMFGIGCAIGVGQTGPGIVIAGIAAVLLHWKQRLHGLVDAMTDKDLRAVMNLALIGLVILPILPDETYGPYDVLNPYDIWRMVVLIVGISMVGYVAYKILGTRVGAILGGVLGGLISSTATTVSYARQTKNSPSISAMAALVILIASAIVNVRVLIEIGVVAPRLLSVAALPMSVMLLVMVIECVLLYLPIRKMDSDPPDHDNPAQLKPAIFFGFLYAVVLFVVAAAREIFGDQALYWIAGISGLTDVDAITLSTAKMFNDNHVEAATAWRVILLATMSNLFFKAGAVALLGSRKLLIYVVVTFGIAAIAGGLLLAYWPEFDAASFGGGKVMEVALAAG